VSDPVIRTREPGQPEPPPTAESRAETQARIRRAVRYCLGVFLGVRIGLGILALVAVAVLPALEAVGAPGWPPPPIEPGWHNLVTAWERFDGLWFLRVATGGYVDGDGSAAFFPLYPMLIRVVSPVLGGHPLAAALLISHAAFFAALVVFYLLTESEYHTAAARRAVLYLALSPTAFFFFAPYSESLFLLLAVSSLAAARRGRWAAAGLAGALASATRSVGVLLPLPLAVEAIHRWKERRENLIGPLLWSAAAILGAAAYLFFWWVKSGDWLAPLHQQATWQREPTLVWETIASGTREAFRWPGVYPGGYHLLDWLVVVPALVAGGWLAVRARPAFSVYVWASLLAPLTLVFPGRPLMSVPRFLLTMFPLLWVPAVLAGRRRWVHEAVLAVFAASLGVMTVLFVDWYYVF
jgi:Mannosyltransferase (PIG-V)